MIEQGVKYTPVFAAAQKLGARFDNRQGWQVPEAFGATENEMESARRGVALADMSAQGKITVEGERAEAVVKGVWKAAELEIHQGMAVDSAGDALASSHLYRLRQDLFYASTPAGAEDGILVALEARAAKAGGLVTATDMTHGRSELWLVGPAAAELLSRLCGLDFHPTQFPDMTAKQSSVAKTGQLVIRHDIGGLPAYALIGGRSLGGYLWETVLEAGRDLEIAPIGYGALQALAMGQE